MSMCECRQRPERTSDPLELELAAVMPALHGCWEQISMEDYKSSLSILTSHSLILVSKDGIPPPPNAVRKHTHLYLKDFLIVTRILPTLSVPRKCPNTELGKCWGSISPSAFAFIIKLTLYVSCGNQVPWLVSVQKLELHRNGLSYKLFRSFWIP